MGILLKIIHTGAGMYIVPFILKKFPFILFFSPFISFSSLLTFLSFFLPFFFYLFLFSSLFSLSLPLLLIAPLQLENLPKRLEKIPPSPGEGEYGTIYIPVQECIL